MRYEFKKWGKGSYELIWLYDYNPVAKMFYRKSIGMIDLQGKLWVASNSNLTAPTRKKLAEKMIARLIS
jgi:hypothetical protein